MQRGPVECADRRVAKGIRQRPQRHTLFGGPPARSADNGWSPSGGLFDDVFREPGRTPCGAIRFPGQRRDRVTVVRSDPPRRLIVHPGQDRLSFLRCDARVRHDVQFRADRQ